VHIPDGFLTGQAAALGTATAIAGVAVCLRGARRTARERDLPLAGLAAAFFLIGEAPLVPLGLGTQAHLLGGALAVALLGPYLGALTITVVCLIQPLVFGDGGITTLGLTITNLALIPAFVGYPLLLALRRMIPLAVACGIMAAVCVMLAAVVFTLEVTLFAAGSIDTRAIAATTLGSYALVALVEGVLTGLIVKGVLAVRPDLVHVARRRAVMT
jgi:cobalt/nickel transport system permease protein